MLTEHTYYDYEQLSATLQRLAQKWPAFTRLSSLGTTDGGREIWLLTLGRRPDAKLPALCVDANMHAGELVGTTLILNFAEAVLGFLENGVMPVGVPEGLQQYLSDGLIHLIPRSSPDGAEAVLKAHGYVRSIPHPEDARESQHWRLQDLDGDGFIKTMRKETPAGRWSELPGSEPAVLVPRRIEDSGPFYECYYEGLIQNPDGRTIPSQFIDAFGLDLNRNYPSGWEGRGKQLGGGDLPLAVRESRILAEFVLSHPNICFWINLHTFGGVVLTPPIHEPADQLGPDEKAVWNLVRELSELHLEYPTHAISAEFAYDPRRPMTGTFMDFLLKERGIPNIVVEVWCPWSEAGLELPPARRYIDNYQAIPRSAYAKLVEWDKTQNDGRVFGGWKPFTHPQLGPVEIGGPSPLFGIVNPTESRLPQISGQHIRFMWSLLSMRPKIEILDVAVSTNSENLSEIRWTVMNTGLLSTTLFESCDLGHINPPLRAKVTALDSGSAQIVGESTTEIGHLAGTLHSYPDFFVLAMPCSRGKPAHITLRTAVVGKGKVMLEVFSERFGSVRSEVEV